MEAMPTRTRVVKKLGARQPGALGWARRFGDALVCVRYRVDMTGERRYTTVGLLVDTAPIVTRRDGNAMVGVRIGYGEIALRERVKTAGAEWDKIAKLWRLPRRQARALGVLHRIAKE